MLMACLLIPHKESMYKENNKEPIMWQLVPNHEYHHNSQTLQEKISVASNDLKYEIIHVQNT